MENHNLDVTFHISKSIKSVILFGILFFGAWLIVSITACFIAPKELLIWWIWAPVIIGYGIFTKMCLDAWKQRNNYIRLNDNYIALHSQETQIELIKWKDVTEVKENNILGMLVLKDKYNKIIKIDYGLENFTELINILMKSIPHLTNQYSKLEKFRRTNHIHLFYTIALLPILCLTSYCMYLENYFFSITLGALSCSIIYVLLIEFIGVRLLEGGVIVIYPLWRKQIEFSQIKNISIENISDRNGKSSPFVILKLTNDKTIKLNAVRDGTIALYSSIKYNLLKNSS